MCYEHELAHDPKAAGYWVGRVSSTAEDRLCDIKTVSTDVPQEMLECIERSIRHQTGYGRVTGTVELAVRYLPPLKWAGPPSHGRL